MVDAVRERIVGTLSISERSLVHLIASRAARLASFIFSAAF